MTREEQVEAMRIALSLEKDNKETQKKLNDLLSLRFESKPSPPKKPELEQIADAVYEKPKSSMKFMDYLKENNRLIIDLLLCFVFVGLYLFYTDYKQFCDLKKKDVERIRNSEEYKAKCRALDYEVEQKRKQAEIKYQNDCEEYNKKLDVYNNEILPEYNERLDAWTTQHNNDIEFTQTQLDEIRQNLVEHYEKTRILPVQYRKIEIMEYIYDMISTSDYDVVQATEKYEQKIQRELEMARLQEQRIANENQEIAIQQNAEQNALLEQQNYELKKTRQHNDIANAVGTYQRHKTNDILSGKHKK